MILDDIYNIINDTADELKDEGISSVGYWIAKMGIDEVEMMDFVYARSYGILLKGLEKNAHPINDILPGGFLLGMFIGYVHAKKESGELVV